MAPARRPLPAALVGVALLVAVGWIYGPTRDFGFVNFDDRSYILENDLLPRGVTPGNLRDVFLEFYEANWHPLTLLSFLVEYRFFGTEASGYHVTNVLLHAATACLLFLALRRLTGDPVPGAFCALLFAVHPVRVESVAWVSERKDLLCGLFAFATLAAYGRLLDAPSTPRRAARSWYAATTVLFVAGLMSKSMIVTLPFVLVLLDAWPRRRFGGPEGWRGLGASVGEKVPLFLITVLGCWIAVLSQGRGGAIQALDSLPIGTRLANAGLAYVAYVRQTVWPVDLAVIYPYPDVIPAGSVAGALGFLIAVTGIAWWLRDRARYVAVGWLWFLGTLVPVIGLVQIGSQPMADRYQYIPGVGLLIIACWGARDLASRLVPDGPFAGGRAAAIAGLVAIVLLAARARDQVGVWRSSETLFSHALSVTDRNYVALNGLGVVRMEQGRVDEALELFGDSLALRPVQSKIVHNVINLHVGRGALDEAVAVLERAGEAGVDATLAHREIGRIRARQARPAEAEPHLRRAAELASDDPEVRLLLGDTLIRLGRVGEGVAVLAEALGLDPSPGARARARALVIVAAVERTGWPDREPGSVPTICIPSEEGDRRPLGQERASSERDPPLAIELRSLEPRSRVRFEVDVQSPACASGDVVWVETDAARGEGGLTLGEGPPGSAHVTVDWGTGRLRVDRAYHERSGLDVSGWSGSPSLPAR